MGKRIRPLIIILLCLFMSVRCLAVDNDELSREYQKGMPDEASELFEDGTDNNDLSAKLDFKSVIGYVAMLLSKQLKNCTGLFVMLSAVTLLMSVLDSIDISRKKTLKNITASAGATTLLMICFSTVQSNVGKIGDAIETMKVFTASAVPVITTLCISGGRSFTAAVFSAAISFTSAVFQLVNENVLLPLVILYLLLGMAGNMSDRFNSFSVDTHIKKLFKWVSSVFIGMFTFILSLQSFVGGASDTLTRRGIKTAVGSFIPVTGSVLSGSIDGLFALASASKTSFAVIGIIVILVIFSPIIIGNICYGLSVFAVKAMAHFLKTERTAKTLGIISDTFFILAGICSACVYMVIISFLLICINI